MLYILIVDGAKRRGDGEPYDQAFPALPPRSGASLPSLPPGSSLRGPGRAMPGT